MTRRKRHRIRTVLAASAVGLAAGAAYVAMKRSRAASSTDSRLRSASLDGGGPDWAARSAEIDGVTMRWLEHGAGRPVVFVHGIPTGPRLWRRVVPRLRGARALAWEMVGYADSIAEGRGRDISVAKQADYLAAWMKHLGIERAVLVGHDLGGGVAQIAAVRHPELCAGLALTNAVGYDSWPIPMVKALRAADGVVKHLPAPAVRSILWTLFRLGHDDGRVASESSGIHWRPYARHRAGEALVRQMRSLDVRDTLAVAQTLPHLGVPARIVWGVADPFQPIEYGERFARDLGTSVRRVEGGRHFMPEDHPEEIASAVNDLVEELDSQEDTSRTQFGSVIPLDQEGANRPDPDR